MRWFLCLLSLCVVSSVTAQQYSAEQYIAAVRAGAPEGGVYARLRMEHSVGGGKASVLQVQVKRRPGTDGGTDQLYQLLYPKERKGEGLLIHINGRQFSGATYAPGLGVENLKSSSAGDALFGTALTIEDLRATFLNWPSQTIIGQEKIGSVPCTIVESKPDASGKGAICARSWIDSTRLVTMRLQFFIGGTDKIVKDVETHKVSRGKSGRYLPVSFTVTNHETGASTKVEGVRSDSGLSYTDADFSPKALETVTAGAGE
ncbi:MAG: outer membrane lipoprotein-sorting protein [Verrucomicrobiales bacterium]|nr:outer membrane lipoprotein-sorting protein [Verrucomicrobiales bacterium]MCP5558481.1 outer membrane lipoprotein-sorting protein [Verrucomicrobiaceae bacterium]